MTSIRKAKKALKRKYCIKQITISVKSEIFSSAECRLVRKKLLIQLISKS